MNEFPSAHVILTRRQHVLMIGQQYKFFVCFKIPEFPANKELGMFMVCVQLKDKYGFLSSQSCRSNMLHYRSDLLYVESIISFPSLNSRQQGRDTYFFDFEEDQKHPVTLRISTLKYKLVISKSIRHHSYQCSFSRVAIFDVSLANNFGSYGDFFQHVCYFLRRIASFYHNFFVNAVPLQIMRDHLRRLETGTARFLKDRSIIPSNSSTENMTEITPDPPETSKVAHSDLVNEE